MKNWKTTTGGIGGLLGAIGDILLGLAHGTPINWGVDIPLILTGAGLLFAKDSNVTGGTVKQ